MARSKKKRKIHEPYLQLPAIWYRESIKEQRAKELAGDDLGGFITERKRLLEEDYLRDGIRLLRKYFKGFGAKDGYDLRKVHRIIPAKEQRLRVLSPLIRQEIASPHVRVVPRTPSQKRAIESFTGQRDFPRRRAYNVFVATEKDAKRTKIKFVTTERKVKDSIGRKRSQEKTAVQVEQKVKGGVLADRFFLLADHVKEDESIATFEDIIKVTRKMLRFMPKGYYVIVTSTHGNIAAPVPKSKLLDYLMADFLVYDKLPSSGHKDNRGLAEVVTGFKLVSYTSEGAHTEYRERLTRRQQAEAFRKQQRAKQRRRALKRLGVL